MEQSRNNVVAYDHDPEEKYFEISNRVFDLEPLREKILDFVIHDNRKVHYSSVKSCRLVNKAWLQSTSRILRKSAEPLFRFRLDGKTPRKMKKHQKLLKQFLGSVISNSRLEKRIPPHSIDVQEAFFRPAHLQTLKTLFDCFVYCGSGLTQLYLELREDQHSVLLNTHVSFPELRSFVIFIVNGQSDTPTAPIESDDRIDFIRNVLKSNKKLETFMFAPTLDPYPAPGSIRNFLLPSSITELNLGCSLNESTLEAVVKNEFPNMKILRLQVNGLPFENDGVITRILHKFRKTLEEFALSGDLPEVNRGSTTLQLPMMERLRSLEIFYAFLELHGHPSSLEQLLPELKCLILTGQTIQKFRKWVDSSCFHSVNYLDVSVCSDDDYGVFVNIDAPSMVALKAAFPNVQKLKVSLEQIHLLDPAFAELWGMKNLTSLEIDTNEFAYGDDWDAFFLGIPVEEVAERRLKRCPDPASFWEELQARNLPSIRNLTELKTLTVVNFVELPSYILISDETFDFVFFKMPKLTNLILHGCLLPTEEMEQKWVKEGRNIITNFQRDD